MAKRRRSSVAQPGVQTATKGPPQKRFKVHAETPVLPTNAAKPLSSAKKVAKVSLGGVFSDQNKSWLKRKAQEDDSDDGLAAPQNSDSDDLNGSDAASVSSQEDGKDEEAGSDQQSSDADQDDDPLGGQTFDMSDEDAAEDQSAPGSDNDSEEDSESDDAAAARKQNGGALQLMSDDDDEDEEGDAGVAGLEGQEDSEEEDMSAASSSDAGTDDSDEFGGGSDEDEEEEEEGDEPLLAIEKRAKILDRKRTKAEKAAAAEAAHIGTDMETNMEEAERFVLPSGIEVEAAGRGPPDLALISRRIKETVRLLDGFKLIDHVQQDGTDAEKGPLWNLS